MALNIGKEYRKQHITIGFLVEKNKTRLKLETLVNVGMDNKVKEKSIHRPGLALAGYVGLFTYDRVQVFGNTEMLYLKSMSLEKRIESFNTLFKFEIPCIVITNNNEMDKELLKIAEDHNVPIFRSPFETTKFVYLLSDFLDDQFSQQSTIHGSFVDVYGIGLLFIGRSGIGKSEIAWRDIAGHHAVQRTRQPHQKITERESDDLPARDLHAEYGGGDFVGTHHVHRQPDPGTFEAAHQDEGHHAQQQCEQHVVGIERDLQ